MGVSLLKRNGQLHSDSTTKCDILADQFKSVFTKDANDTHRATKLYGPSYPQMPEFIIQEQGVRKLLAGVKSSKASGPDEIPCRLLRELLDELAPVFMRLFKQTYSSGKLPSPWTAAWTSPIFRKGTRSDASNYRPILLTCVACKLFEHILCSHIRAHLDAHWILTPVNHGFHSKHSCESQLLITCHDIYQRLDRREQIDIWVLDFSKAFDTVPHRKLINKLEFKRRCCGFGRASGNCPRTAPLPYIYIYIYIYISPTCLALSTLALQSDYSQKTAWYIAPSTAKPTNSSFRKI